MKSRITNREITNYSVTSIRCRTFKIMPRVAGVSGSSTECRMRRSPIPSTVFACVLLKPIVLRRRVIFNFFAAGFAAFACAVFFAIRFTLLCPDQLG